MGTPFFSYKSGNNLQAGVAFRFWIINPFTRKLGFSSLLLAMLLGISACSSEAGDAQLLSESLVQNSNQQTSPLIFPNDPLALSPETKTFLLQGGISQAWILEPGKNKEHARKLFYQDQGKESLFSLPSDFLLRSSENYILILGDLDGGKSLALQTSDLSAEKQGEALQIQGLRITTPGARSDDLLEPHFFEVPSSAKLLVQSNYPLLLGQKNQARIKLFRAGNKQIPLRIERGAGQELEISSFEPLERGESYSMVFEAGLQDVRGIELKKSYRTCLFVREHGALKSFSQDFNGDFQDDRLFVFSSNSLGLILGEAEEDLREHEIALPELTRIQDADVGDFDGDGRIDIVLLGYSYQEEASLLFMHNTSTGGMPTFRVYTLTLESLKLPRGLAVIDLERDGKPDLACIGLEGKLLLLENQGLLKLKQGEKKSTVFQHLQSFAFTNIERGIGSIPAFTGLDCGDLDQNGEDDLVLSGWPGAVFLNPSTKVQDQTRFLVLSPEFGGSLLRTLKIKNQAASILALSSTALSRLQLETSEQTWKEEDLLNKADGLAAVFCCDFDGNHSQDLLLAYASQESNSSLRLRHWLTLDQGFEDQGGIDLKGSYGRINHLEYLKEEATLLISSEQGFFEFDFSSELLSLLSFESRIFFEHPQKIGYLPHFQHYVLSDFNADGAYDIAGIFHDEENEEVDQSLLGVWLNKREGREERFVESFQTPLPDKESTFMVLKANEDPFPDLLIRPSSGEESLAHLYYARGDGLFNPLTGLETLEVPKQAQGLPLQADFNGDGKEDLFWATPHGAVSFGGNPSFHKPLELPALYDEFGEPFKLQKVFKAYDAEHTPFDVLGVGNSEGGMRLVLYRNSLRYGTVNPDFEGRFLEGRFEHIEKIFVGRFDRNKLGVLALVQQAGIWQLLLWSDFQSSPQILELNGQSILETQPSDLQVIDVDQDGDSDIALRLSSQSQSLLLFVNRGDAQFSLDTISSDALFQTQIEEEVYSMHLFDLNGDSLPDLFVRDRSGNLHRSLAR